MSTFNDVRSSFIQFFEERDHVCVPSSPLVPQNDPSLLFVNAGMVPFKDAFLGREKRDYSRAVSVQKCVRAGGKHNDLENVGHTFRHHTFFEMLGNFSFGDYFKEEAVTFAWSFVRLLDLDTQRLLVTVFHEDEETAELWKKIAGFRDDKIIRIKTSDNFWSMGDVGPCGPCTELFYDHGSHIPGGPPGSADEDGDRFVEIWNIVFMAYNRLAPGKELPLPCPCVDTGMGIERIVAVLEGVCDNYETSLFRELIRGVERTLNTSNQTAKQEIAHKVVVDHLRATCFLIADGVLPSNEGRGYVLRRIMRRAMRYLDVLGVSSVAMHKLVPLLVHEMGDTYQELPRAQALTMSVLEQEEERFRQALGKGLILLERALQDHVRDGVLPGEIAFRLYDTYGFPIDLTQDVLKERSLSLDVEGFEKCLQEQKQSGAGFAGSKQEQAKGFWLELKKSLAPTRFLGYDVLCSSARVEVVQSREDQGTKTFDVVFDQTPFYAEQGGQMADCGIVCDERGECIARVIDVQKEQGFFVHTLALDQDQIGLKVGDVARLVVDSSRREGLKAHHSATHLLHAALRKHLGTHVTQKGSLVDEGRLRFDFAHPEPLSSHQRACIEEQVNEWILDNVPAHTEVMGQKDAVARGALALFGEKYDDKVRVLSFVNANGHTYSIELCGGTHVSRSGDIGFFKIITQSAVGSGVRRIEAIAHRAALEHFQDLSRTVEGLGTRLSVSPKEVPEELEHVLEKVKHLEQSLFRERVERAKEAPLKAVEHNDAYFYTQVVEGVGPKELLTLMDQRRATHEKATFVIISHLDGNKAHVLVGLSKSEEERLDACALLKALPPHLGIKGGGRCALAQAGGEFFSHTQEVLKALEESWKACVTSS